jgi:uncharacterized protein HemY
MQSYMHSLSLTTNVILLVALLVVWIVALRLVTRRARKKLGK